MNFVSLLTRDEAVAGIEISETHVRAGLIVVTRSTKPTERRKFYFAEEPLPEGVIVGSELQKKEALANALQKLAKRVPMGIRYAVVSIPSDAAYSKVFTFPHTVSGRRLEETMRLTIGFQLPIKPDQAFLDWERVEQGDLSKILLVAMPRPVIEPYLAALQLAKVKPIALELAPLSFARVISAPSGEAELVTLPGRGAVTFIVVKDGAPRFLRTVPADKLKTAEDYSMEQRTIVDFYESETGFAITSRSTYANLHVLPEYEPHLPAGESAYRWMTVLGAAVRGAMPRSEDNFISLLSVNTHTAYEHQKALVFGEFISGLCVATAAFLILAFCGAWGLLAFLQYQAGLRVQSYSNISIPADAIEIESRIASLNSRLTFAGQIVRAMPRWSEFVRQFPPLVPPGITILNLTTGLPTDPITVSGLTRDRATLSAFKTNLENSGLFATVTLPLTNLELAANIPFNLSLTLADPANLYFH